MYILTLPTSLNRMRYGHRKPLRVTRVDREKSNYRITRKNTTNFLL